MPSTLAARNRFFMTNACEFTAQGESMICHSFVALQEQLLAALH